MEVEKKGAALGLEGLEKKVGLQEVAEGKVTES